MEDVHAKIDAYRIKIDKVDERLVELLNERARLANAIGVIKRRHNLPVYVPAREEEVIRHVIDINRGPLTWQAMRRLFERIIDESRRLEKEASSITSYED